MSIPRILHYLGSKWSLASWIISHFPEHETYLEPFFGSGAVLFSKQRSQLETVNDLDGEIVNLFKIIRSRPDELAHAIRLTPHSREEYYNRYLEVEDELERARRLIVRLWQGRGGKTAHRTGWRSMIEMNDPLPGKEWVSDKTQGRNKRSNKIIEIDGVEKTLIEWTEHFNINVKTVQDRLKRGWNEKDALTIPTDERYSSRVNV